LMTGIQALVRVSIDRRALDERLGLDTCGFFSGYRGSPLAGMDQELARNGELLAQRQIRFIPGVNEELGAAMVWGTQKIATKDVFGIWYGKGPGVDRAADVLRQANATGASGGVLALCGDDLAAKSSMLPNQSEFLLEHVEMPFLNPANVQELRDYGLHALEMSRASGAWAAMVCSADVVDSSGLVDLDLEDKFLPRLEKNDGRRPGGGGIITRDGRALYTGNRLETERVARQVRLPKAMEYVRRHKLDGVKLGRPEAPVGFVATGRAYHDLVDAFDLLGLGGGRDDFCVYKVAVPWPLDKESIRDFAAKNKRRLVVVEHKRAFIEPQIKDALYGHSNVEVWGKTRGEQPFLSDVKSIELHDLARAVAAALDFDSSYPYLRDGDGGVVAAAARHLEEHVAEAEKKAMQGTAQRRKPFFCAGCPHATSTKIPAGARALPGIGCHLMAETTGDITDGLPAMGVEGAPFIGQTPFLGDKTTHAFVNLGDGTYHHSGSLAIRQAVAAKSANVTFKILYNDAVAMTGGQPHDGPLTVDRVVRQVQAEGVAKVAVVVEDREKDLATAALCDVVHRDDLPRLQKEFAATAGVTVIVYDQACAAEKRRKRRRGLAPDPPKRLFINEAVCEGCGDCSVQSSCIAVEPVDTAFGEKRKINQSLCNKDFSCVKGFCPSFAWIETTGKKGVAPPRVRKASDEVWAAVEGAVDADLADLADGPITKKRNVLVAGVGGLGVTTTSAILGAAALMEGVAVATLDVTGLAQKNGPVTSHLRFDDVRGAPRIPIMAADTLIACDALVACDAGVLATLDSRKSLVVANTRVMPTADFVTKGVRADADYGAMKDILAKSSRALVEVDATKIAEALLGDVIYANVVCLGAAFQRGGLPLSAKSIEAAIEANGASVNANKVAFKAGRLLAADPKRLYELLGLPSEDTTTPKSLAEKIDAFAAELTEYQNEAYADRYRRAVAKVRDVDDDVDDDDDFEGRRRRRTTLLTEAVAFSLFRAMAYKDEYEVARLYSAPAFREKLREQFLDDEKNLVISPVFAPPLLSPLDPATGRPKKLTFRGPWVFPALQALASLKVLRGSWLDVCALLNWTDRKHERDLVDLAFDDVDFIVDSLKTSKNYYDLLVDLATVPGDVKGFGPVKEANRRKALARRAALRAEITNATSASSADYHAPSTISSSAPASSVTTSKEDTGGARPSVVAHQQRL